MRTQRTTYCGQGHEYTPSNTYLNPGSGQRACRTCSRDSRERWRGKNPLYHRRRWLKRAYGLTLEEYEAKLAAQNGCCAICGTDQPDIKGIWFAVDHDHETGRVRAILCTSCNLGLGSLRDDPIVVEKALQYLQFWKEK